MKINYNILGRLIIAILILIVITLYFIHILHTIPNQACQKCGYDNATDVTLNLMGGKAECEGRKIIEYETTYQTINKWGYTVYETGLLVWCNEHIGVY